MTNDSDTQPVYAPGMVGKFFNWTVYTSMDTKVSEVFAYFVMAPTLFILAVYVLSGLGHYLWSHV